MGIREAKFIKDKLWNYDFLDKAILCLFFIYFFILKGGLWGGEAPDRVMGK